MFKPQTTKAAARRVEATKYDGFVGVDFSGDPTKIDRRRLAYAQNILLEANGYPEKRPGVRTVHTYPAQIHGLYAAWGELFVHAGDTLYRGTQAVGTLAEHESCGFAFQGKLYILDGSRYNVYDGTELKEVEGYIPTTSTHGGTPLEPVNLLTPWRKNTFVGDGETKAFVLDGEGQNPTARVFDGTTWQQAECTLAGRTVTLEQAPPASSEANVEITFSCGQAKHISRCRVAERLQFGNGVYFFAAGDPAVPNTDFRSHINDPTYFPDTAYARYGSDSPILGYGACGSQLAVLKEDEIFLRSGALNEAGQPTFPIVPYGRLGAVNGKCFANVDGEPLLLTRDGVYALTAEGPRPRSYFINGKLLKEDLKKAVAGVWNNRLLLSVGDNAYVLDGNLSKSYKPDSNGEYSLEGTYFTNFGATHFINLAGELYMAQGPKLKKLNTDIADTSRYNDDDRAVVAIVSTRADDDGDFMMRKTMKKRGSGVLLKPFTRSSIKVYAATTDFSDKLIAQATMDILDWNDVDFTRFTFHTQDTPQVVPFLTAEKNYTTLQLTAVNDQMYEGFGVLGFIKRFERVGYRKG